MHRLVFFSLFSKTARNAHRTDFFSGSCGHTLINRFAKELTETPVDFDVFCVTIATDNSLFMSVLPEPIHKGQETLWETLIDTVVERYPFI